MQVAKNGSMSVDISAASSLIRGNWIMFVLDYSLPGLLGSALDHGLVVFLNFGE